MLRDPYIAYWWRRRRNQIRGEGLVGLVRSVGVPLMSAVLMVPLVRVLFLDFLDEGRVFWSQGVEQVVLRAALVVIGWLSLDVYAALIRGQHRTVLALLPVHTPGVVRAQLLEVAASRWWLFAGAAIVLSPIALEGAPILWALSLVALLGAFAVGLFGSAAVHLAAVAVAEDPRWAGLLDLARGNNPRAQAAFIYAPGVVLIGAGWVAFRAAHGIRAAALGDPLGALELALPFAIALLCALPVPRLARSQWFRGSAVVADIDARYAALSDPEEELRVYLDWVVRFLPERVALFALDDLRHGWRQRRTLVTGAWLVAALALAAGWTEQEIGPPRVAVVVILGTFLVAANGVVLARDEPEFLQVWLPPRGAAGAAARAAVLALWLLPIGFGGALAVWFFHDLARAGWVLGVAAIAAAVAVPSALLCARSRLRGMAAYAPLATVLSVALAAALGSP
ncbi:MAG: hypothetical protein KTR31_38235 [Myxococcales bacterium]|nr:hypothetical protein [Myxococcales bacterium]